MLAALTLAAPEEKFSRELHNIEDIPKEVIITKQYSCKNNIQTNNLLAMYERLKENIEMSKHALILGKCYILKEEGKDIFVFTTPMRFVEGAEGLKKLFDKNDNQKAQIYLKIFKAFIFFNKQGIITNFVKFDNIVFEASDTSFSNPLIRSLSMAFYKNSKPEDLFNRYPPFMIEKNQITEHGVSCYSEIHQIVKFLFALEVWTKTSPRDQRDYLHSHHIYKIMQDDELKEHNYEGWKEKKSLYNFLYSVIQKKTWKNEEFEQVLTRFAGPLQHLQP